MQRVVASWFGTGLILGRVRGSDIGSGTVGALFAFPVAFLIGEWGGWQAQVAAAVIVVGLSLWSTGRLASTEGDAGWIVIDEAGGAFVAVVGLSFWPGAVVAWLAFRIADIYKNFFPGVGAAERLLPGGVGITADDVVAGIYGLAAGWLAQGLI